VKPVITVMNEDELGALMFIVIVATAKTIKNNEQIRRQICAGTI
jgi:hypothetical protein